MKTQKDEVIALSTSDIDSIVDNSELFHDVNSLETISVAEIVSYACPSCGLSFETKDLLNRHALLHSLNGPFPCDYCTEEFEDKYSLRTHWRANHGGNGCEMCNTCGQFFTFKESLAEHQNLHNKGKRHRCIECSKTFADKSDLRKHALTHTGVRPYVCSICSKAFTRSTNLNKHQKLHTGDKPYSCNQCPKTFSCKGDLGRHQIIHSGIKPFSCSICTSSFTRKDKLTKHEKLHKKGAPLAFKCPVCPAVFTRKEELTKHIHFAHFSTGTLNIVEQSCSDMKPGQEEVVQMNPSDIVSIVDNSELFQVNSLETIRAISLSDSASYTCPFCSKNVETKELLTRHLLIHTQDGPFPCDYCSAEFDDKYSLCSHWRTFHSGDGCEICNTCGQMFNTKDSLAEHQDLHNKTMNIVEQRNSGMKSVKENLKVVEINSSDLVSIVNNPELFPQVNSLETISDAEHIVYTCSTCGKNLSTKQLLTRHLLIHTQNGPFPCDYCSQEYKDKYSLNIHWRSHRGSGGYEMCNTCGQFFPTKDSVAEHQKLHDKALNIMEQGTLEMKNGKDDIGDMSPSDIDSIVRNANLFPQVNTLESISVAESLAYPCPSCSIEFETKELLARHVQIHTQSGPFPCDYCSEEFEDKYSLRTHWRSNHGSNGCKMCNTCGQFFSTIESLLEHQDLHDRRKRHKCVDCGKAFSDKSDLRKHVIIHTGVRPYVCSICCKSFTRSTNLNKHQKLHTGFRPFSCNQCPKTFSCKGDLGRHQIIHSGLKPFSCSFCTHSFTRKDKLTKHEKLHKKGAPLAFTCPVCPAAFTRKEELTKHSQFTHFSSGMDGLLLYVSELVKENESSKESATLSLSSEENVQSALEVVCPLQSTQDELELGQPTPVVSCQSITYVHASDTPQLNSLETKNNSVVLNRNCCDSDLKLKTEFVDCTNLS